MAPKAGPSPEVRAYLEYMQPRLQLLSQAFERLGQQSDRLSKEPALLNEQAWRTETVAVLTTMKTVGVELQGCGTVPAAAALLDATLKVIGRDLVAATDELSVGLETDSIPRINDALRRMQGVRDRLPQATEQFNALARGGRRSASALMPGAPAGGVTGVLSRLRR